LFIALVDPTDPIPQGILTSIFRDRNDLGRDHT
jgi:hypothetical protein